HVPAHPGLVADPQAGDRAEVADLALRGGVHFDLPLSGPPLAAQRDQYRPQPGAPPSKWPKKFQDFRPSVLGYHSLPGKMARIGLPIPEAPNGVSWLYGTPSPLKWPGMAKAGGP